MSDYTFQCEHGVVFATPGGSFIFRTDRGHSLEDLQTAIARAYHTLQSRLAELETAASEYHTAAQNLMEVASGYDCEDEKFDEMEGVLIEKAAALRAALKH